MSELDSLYRSVIAGEISEGVDGIYLDDSDAQLDGFGRRMRRLRRRAKKFQRSKIGKILKKAAPLAAVGAAGFFGGPAGIAAVNKVKKMRGRAISIRNRAKSARSRLKGAVDKVAANPKYSQLTRLRDEIRADRRKYEQNLPAIQEFGADVMREIASSEGVTMNSQKSRELARLEMRGNMVSGSADKKLLMMGGGAAVVLGGLYLVTRK